jgi:hypothetical protein
MAFTITKFQLETHEMLPNTHYDDILEYDIILGCFFQGISTQNDCLQQGDSVQSLLEMFTGWFQS